MKRSNLLFLLGHLGLHLLLVEQLGGVLESKWEFLIKHSSIFLDFLRVSVLQGAKSLGILLLGLQEILVPLLVELLVLLDVSLLALLLLLGLVENQFLALLLIVLLFELLKSLLSHFSLDILALGFAVVSVFIENLPVVWNIRGEGYEFLVLTCILGCSQCLAERT